MTKLQLLLDKVLFITTFIFLFSLFTTNAIFITFATFAWGMSFLLVLFND